MTADLAIIAMAVVSLVNGALDHRHRDRAVSLELAQLSGKGPTPAQGRQDLLERMPVAFPGHHGLLRPVRQRPARRHEQAGGRSVPGRQPAAGAAAHRPGRG